MRSSSTMRSTTPLVLGFGTRTRCGSLALVLILFMAAALSTAFSYPTTRTTRAATTTSFSRSSEASLFQRRQYADRNHHRQQQQKLLQRHDHYRKGCVSSSSSSSSLWLTNGEGNDKPSGNFGDLFKKRAQLAEAKSYQLPAMVGGGGSSDGSDGSSSSSIILRRLWFTIQSSFFYLLFILYRGYRGFFVLLPAVFQRVYAKLEIAMMDSELSLLSEDEEKDETALSTTTTTTSTTKWRTKATVSLMATIVTVSYVLGGILRMATSFVKTITKTSSVPKSLEAAAEEMSNQEGRLSQGIILPPSKKKPNDDDDNSQDLSP